MPIEPIVDYQSVLDFDVKKLECLCNKYFHSSLIFGKESMLKFKHSSFSHQSKTLKYYQLLGFGITN
jgi:hypothetical protein